MASLQWSCYRCHPGSSSYRCFSIELFLKDWIFSIGDTDEIGPLQLTAVSESRPEREGIHQMITFRIYN